MVRIDRMRRYRLGTTLWVATFLHSAVFAGVALEKVFSAPDPMAGAIVLEAGPGWAAPTRTQVAREARRKPAPAEIPDYSPDDSDSDEDAEELAGNTDDAIAKGTTSDPVGNQGGETSPRALYIAGVRQAIEKARRYPGASRSLGETGTVLVSFRIEHDGTIAAIEMRRPCAFDRLNREALATLVRVEKVPAIPAELQLASLELTQPIDFDLN